MNMIRKGQVRWIAKGDIAAQAMFVEAFSVSPVDYPHGKLTPSTLSASYCNTTLLPLPRRYGHCRILRR